MPNVTAPTRNMSNGDVVTQFIDSVGTTPVTYTYPKTQEKFIMRNMGPSSLSVTVAGVTQMIERGEKWQKVADFTSFSINAVSGYVAFDAWADEKGSTFDSAEGQYFAGGVTSGGGTGVSVYATLSDLQAALPGGSTNPVWVTADNSWYYWNGVAAPADTTPPTVTANPASGTYAGTQSVVLSANETATIYYTTDGSTPTISSAVYSSAISVAATGTVKAIGKDTAGNTSTPVSFAYTITVVTIPSTPTTPTATAGNNNVDLAWTAVSGATSYKVYRGGTLLASPTTNSYSDATAVNGTTYSYTVSAVNTAGESSQSSAASATPAAPPSANRLALNGVDTGINLPLSVTFNTIELEVDIKSLNNGGSTNAGYLFDFRANTGGLTNGYVFDGGVGAGISTYSIDSVAGTDKTTHWAAITKNVKHTLRYSGAAFTPGSEITVFKRANFAQAYLRVEVYKIRLYNTATLVAEYDFTTQFGGTTVPDSSGNGRTATIVGAGYSWLT